MDPAAGQAQGAEGRAHARTLPKVISAGGPEAYGAAMTRILASALAICAACALAGSAASAAEDAFGAAQIEVLPGWRTDRGTHMAALRVTLAPGWKTYWRAPGDAGIPPRFSWQGSQNVAAVAFHWPRPEVHVLNGMRSIGYFGELVLPMEFTPADPASPMTIGGQVELGICRDVCVPVSAPMAAALAPVNAPDPRIAAALSARPQGAREGGITHVSCDVEPIPDGLRLTAHIDMPAIGRNEVAVIEVADSRIWVSEADDRRDGGRLSASSDLVPPTGAPFLLDRSDVRVTILGDDRAVEFMGCPAG
jgi:DsbC/DsbD-like thiol-disulfide interchange protein